MDPRYPTVITGSRDSSTNFNTAQRKVDMQNDIFELQPAMTPLTALLVKISKEVATNSKYEWLEDEAMPYWDAINNGGGYSAVATGLVVDNPTYFEIGQIIRFPRTGENARITNVVEATSTLTVVRGSGAQALNDNEVIMIVTSGAEEGARSNSAKQVKLTNLYNYTEIFRTPVEITGTEQATEMHGGNDMDRQRNKAGRFHAEKIERAFWFGKKLLTTGANGKPLRYTGGIFEFLTSNITDFGGMMTEYDWDKFHELALGYGSMSKIAFMAARPISVVNGFAKGKLYVVEQAKKEYGLNIVKYVSPHGDINMVKHPMFEGTVFGYYAAVIDLADDVVEYRFLKGRDTSLKQSIQENDEDSDKDEYFTEAGLQFANEARHALGTNIKS